MASATALNGSADVGPVADVVAGASAASVAGGVWSWVDAVPWWDRRVVRLPAVDAAACKRAPYIARLLVRVALADWGLSEVRCPAEGDGTLLYDTAAECVSEMVTNSGSHVRWDLVPAAERAIGLTLLRLDDRLMVEVTDPEPVKRRRAVSDAQVASGSVTRGRGLWLVGAYVDVWGGAHGIQTIPDNGGKAAWFWLPLGPGPP
jgi:hypothetical protein